MANQIHVDLLKQGSTVWNAWRNQHPEVRPDLRGAYLRYAHLRGAYLRYAHLSGAYLSGTDLSGTDLSYALLNGADLSGVNLNGIKLSGVKFSGVNLRRADLSGADLSGADLSGVNLSGVNLSGVNLSGQDLSYKNLSGADLSGADLSRALLIGTNFTGATLIDCNIYGISAWDVQLDGAEQLNLTITQVGQPTITVDNLKVAQFIYLLLDNKEIRDVIDTLTTKSVLILGRFGKERKPVLDALRDALRIRNYLPILFDFENPKNRDVAETVRTLAHLAHLILVDLTDPSSTPFELGMIVSDLEVPVQPLLLETEREFSMFKSLTKYDWVLDIHKYADIPSLLASLGNLLTSAEKMFDELVVKKARRLTRR